MTRLGWFLRGASAAALAAGLGIVAAWPIYRSPWLLVVALAGVLLGAGLAAASSRWRWSPFTTVLALLGVFLLTVVPVAEPQRFAELAAAPGTAIPSLGRGIVDGLASVVLGWKQLLTLTLPVGTYQAVLVPAYLVFLLSALLVVGAALRGGRIAPLAAIPLLVPVAFGAVFGAAAASPPMPLGPVTIPAPREIALWCATGGLAAIWVMWSSGVDRRSALRRGRIEGSRSSPATSTGRVRRWSLGLAILALAVSVALLAAPLLSAARAGERAALRDDIDPAVVLRERPTPLSAYRVFKRDDAFDAPLFTVRTEGGTPARLRLAVLDAYDGVDFHVGTGEAERFTRFPSSGPVPEPVTVTVSVQAGYADIWAPIADLGSVPRFTGPRAAELADSFFVNRSAEAAIAVPATSREGADGAESGDGPGLRDGDGYRVTMSAEKDPTLRSGPGSSSSAKAGSAGVDLDAMPQLAAWLQLQDQPANAEGLSELIARLRARGYLSHSLNADGGDPLWLTQLNKSYGTVFQASPGGQSISRIEALFAQLNAQQRSAGSSAGSRELVAGIGDDEQFSVAAALIARALGFESRVVLGVRLDARDGSADRTGDPVPGVPNCLDTCTGENLAAWIEVRGADGIWAPLDVTPQSSDRPSAPAKGQRFPEYPSIPDQRDAREVEPPVGVGEPDESDAPSRPPGREDPASSDALRIAGLASTALALVALPLLFLPLAKRIRARRRRRDPHPELRAIGAWYEAVGLAQDLRILPVSSGRGARNPRSRREGATLRETRGELADEMSAAGFFAAPLLAREVDAAVFSAEGISAARADALWQEVGAQRASVLARLSFWRRWSARYSLRSYGIRFAVPWRGARESTVRQHVRHGANGPDADGSTNPTGKVSS